MGKSSNMNKHYSSLLVLIMVIPVICSTGQEFIKSPKVKKIYPSKAQYVELEADIVAIANRVTEVLCEALISANSDQRQALDVVNDYVDSEKDCFLKQATKDELLQRYNHRLRTKQRLERMIECLLAD